MSTAWTKGDRKARRQLEKALKSDETDNVTRFALVRLLANKAEPVAAEVKTHCIYLDYKPRCATELRSKYILEECSRLLSI